MCVPKESIKNPTIKYIYISFKIVFGSWVAVNSKIVRSIKVGKTEKKYVTIFGILSQKIGELSKKSSKRTLNNNHFSWKATIIILKTSFSVFPLLRCYLYFCLFVCLFSCFWLVKLLSKSTSIKENKAIGISCLNLQI